MFLNDTNTASVKLPNLLQAAETAARAIPPAFPLEATVAVNPFLGQTGEDLATASARLERVAGVSATQSTAAYQAMLENGHLAEDDLSAALDASTAAQKPADVAALKSMAAAPGDDTAAALPTIADLAAKATGTDWPSVIRKSIGLWAAGHFDRGQALWSPRPGSAAFGGWRAWAMHDLTPEIAGLSGFCMRVAEAPDTAERAIMRTSDDLGLCDASAETVFHRLFMDIGGWSQHARWLLWQAELAGQTDRTMGDMLAIRLLWEEALLAHVPGIAEAWAETLAAHKRPVEASETQVAMAILQEASERAYQRHLFASLDGPAESKDRPLLQAAFCIDVRSEVFRRALESIDPSIETIGFAGFFGLPLEHKAQGSDVAEAHLPVLLTPAVQTSSHGDPSEEQDLRIAARATRAWGRFRQAAVSSFAFVEAAGPVYAGKLLRDALALDGGGQKAGPAPQVIGGLSAEQKADTAAAVLSAMSMTKGLGKIVLLLGHGAQVTNNPHESAYHCGACGGHTGEVSARLLAALLNDPETRAGLAARDIDLPEDTVFIAGLHDTTTDEITMYQDAVAKDKADDLWRVTRWLEQAGQIARSERAGALPGSTADTVARRALNWAEVRPEWGLAGCAAFIAAPRNATAGKDLGGRAFLHSYDWQADKGFGTLELILTAPVVVASWISLQYYGSSVARDVFGGGNKLIHNVVGGIGVVEGNGGRLRPGLPWQAVHDGEELVHAPLRLSVMIEAPREAINDVLAKHPDVRALFDNGWLHLFAMKEGVVDARYEPGLGWSAQTAASLAA
ncbi:MAG: DUF2309 domain-containing protein [Pseudomonadota bacterium]